jgi:uncharacterized protein
VSYVGFIVKCTRLCNLRCGYCHDWRAEKDQTMPLEALAAFTQRALEDDQHSSVDFIWHGGEPTVLPLRFFEQALYLQARYRRVGQRVCNILQTNGTGFDDKWIRFVKDYQFGLGISMDGPPAVHDRSRPFVSGRGSSASVAASIKRLQEAEVPFTVLMVIDNATLTLGPDYVFDFLLSYGIKQVSCIAAKPTNQPEAKPGTPATNYAAPAQMAKFLGGLFERWLDHGDESIEIRELRGILNRLLGEAPGTCTLAGDCLGRYYLVEPNGDIAHCDLFLGDASYSLGNITSQKFTQIRQSGNLTKLIQERKGALDLMRKCPDFQVCNGWCPHERYLSRRHNPDHSDTCCGLSDLITRVRQSLVSRGYNPHPVPV